MKVSLKILMVLISVISFSALLYARAPSIPDVSPDHKRTHKIGTTSETPFLHRFIPTPNSPIHCRVCGGS